MSQTEILKIIAENTGISPKEIWAKANLINSVSLYSLYRKKLVSKEYREGKWHYQITEEGKKLLT